MSFFYINKSGERAFSADFLWADSFWNGVACVKDRKEGICFIDKQGNILVKTPEFQTEPTRFDEGKAPIRQGRMVGFIDFQGTICILPKFYAGSRFRENLAPVLPSSDGYVFINHSGEVVSKERFSRLEEFRNGLSLAKKAGRFYFLNKALCSVLGPFEHAHDFSEGIANVLFDGIHCYIDAHGEVVFKNRWDHLSTSCNEGRISFGQDEKTGFLDTKGNVVIEAEFDEAESFSEGLAMVEVERRKFMIGLHGEHLFSVPFQSLNRFSEGLAAFKENGKWGYIDSNGVRVIENRFDVAGDFSDGLAPVACEAR